MQGKRVLVFALALAGCNASPEAAAVESKCYTEGVRYYKAIGSWPTLSTGGDASDLIEKHCARNPDMFKDMPY